MAYRGASPEEPSFGYLGGCIAAYLILDLLLLFLLFTVCHATLSGPRCLFGQFPGAVYNAMSFSLLIVSAMPISKSFLLLPVLCP